MEVINHVQSLLLNYLSAFFRGGDFTLVYYQMGELVYIPFVVKLGERGAARAQNVMVTMGPRL